MGERGGMIRKIKVSLLITIIALLLIVGTMNVFWTMECITIDQLIRICSLLSGSAIGSTIYAVCKIDKIDREGM